MANSARKFFQLCDRLLQLNFVLDLFSRTFRLSLEFLTLHLQVSMLFSAFRSNLYWVVWFLARPWAVRSLFLPVLLALRPRLSSCLLPLKLGFPRLNLEPPGFSKLDSSWSDWRTDDMWRLPSGFVPSSMYARRSHISASCRFSLNSWAWGVFVRQSKLITLEVRSVSLIEFVLKLHGVFEWTIVIHQFTCLDVQFSERAKVSSTAARRLGSFPALTSWVSFNWDEDEYNFMIQYEIQ